MRYFFSLLVFCMMLTQSNALSAADSLFSAVPIDSVFASPGPSPGVPAAANVGGEKPATPPLDFGVRKPFAVGQLSELLRDAGFESKELAERTFATQAKLDTGTLPVVVTVSDDQKQLSVALMLSVVKDEKQIPVDKLLALMTANQQYAPAYFSYSTQHKRTELLRSFNSHEVTSDLLKKEINHLASIAKETQTLWNFANSTPAISSPAKSVPAPAPAPVLGTAKPPVASAPATTDSVVGKWSATPTEKEAFAMLLNADGKFVLVHVNQGKQTRSAGKFTHEKQTLTLIGDDGTQISGTISSQTAQDFTLQLQTKAEKPTVLAFRRAK